MWADIVNVVAVVEGITADVVSAQLPADELWLDVVGEWLLLLWGWWWLWSAAVMEQGVLVVVVVMALLDEVLCSEHGAGAVGSSVSRRAISRSRRTSVSFESIRLKRLAKNTNTSYIHNNMDISMSSFQLTCATPLNGQKSNWDACADRGAQSHGSAPRIGERWRGTAIAGFYALCSRMSWEIRLRIWWGKWTRRWPFSGWTSLRSRCIGAQVHVFSCLSRRTTSTFWLTKTK